MEQKELNLMRVLSDDKLTFSYNNRYAIKEKDPEKQRFCSNVTASKEYENLLRDYAHLLVRNV